MEEYDFMTTVPQDEKGAQAGDEDYIERAELEARTLIKQIKSEKGRPPGRSYFKIVEHDHDFGTLLSLCFVYDPSDEEQSDYFSELEYNFPYEWSEESNEVLK